MTLRRQLARAAVRLAVLVSAASLPAAEILFVATPLTEGGFTEGIEGPACDRDGAIYCVSFREAHNIARVTPEGRVELFVALPEGSRGNGIRFEPAVAMFVAEYTGHKVLRVEMSTRSRSRHDAAMNQPNTRDGADARCTPAIRLEERPTRSRITRNGRAHREAAGRARPTASR
jgi:streptogramin lyase